MNLHKRTDMYIVCVHYGQWTNIGLLRYTNYFVQDFGFRSQWYVRFGMESLVEIFVQVRETTIEFVSPYLAYPSPIEFDCTAGIVCPDGKSCSFQGGYYIHCKHGLVKDWVQAHRNISFGILVVVLSCALYIFVLIVGQVSRQAVETASERAKRDKIE